MLNYCGGSILILTCFSFLQNISKPEGLAVALPLPVEDLLNPLAIRLRFEKRDISFNFWPEYVKKYW